MEIIDPHIAKRSWFFCGIGGSGMLPLATIVRAIGAKVAGSDRSRDQGRTPEKFAWLEKQGIDLFPQDGTGMTSPDQILVASAAVEDTVPEVVRAKALGCQRLSRAQLLASLFNASPHSIAVGGTSGKSTMTGMIGWILTQTGRDPTIINGAVMKNFVTQSSPFASAKVGTGSHFVAEVDESDGSIALYNPAVAVLGNIGLDHKSLDELRALFQSFLEQSKTAIVNLDDHESAAIAKHLTGPVISFAIHSAEAMIGVIPGSIIEAPHNLTAKVIDRRDNTSVTLTLPVPGQHNLANALAAIAAANTAGVGLSDAVTALASFKGLSRRFEIIGTSSDGITVIDDFGHNPDKVAATLKTLKAHAGRVIALFQPHGYGPLRQMGAELAGVFARGLGRDDILLISDPVYFGGTVNRSQGSDYIVQLINQAGGNAEYYPTREECAQHILAQAKPGDRIVIMGARDDTLNAFAHEVLQSLLK